MAATERASLEQIQAWLEGLLRAAFDFTTTLERCRIAIVAATKGNFAAGHAPDGTPWPPLKFGRPGQKTGGRPLRDKNLLMASVTARNAKGNIERRTPTHLEWGSNLDKAPVHQFGATIRPTKARALAIPLTKDAARAGSPRNMPGLFRAGRFLATEKQTRRKGLRELVRHYVLASQVKIPARPFLGWGTDLVEECGEIIADGGSGAIAEASVTGGGTIRLSA